METSALPAPLPSALLVLPALLVLSVTSVMSEVSVMSVEARAALLGMLATPAMAPSAVPALPVPVRLLADITGRVVPALRPVR